ncbi:MAG: 2-C-methyl-D-erythritol 2,4-cyclodiphosphate synthase [Gammaproteobacteria bacterium]|nr:MAG: 2-C-methyl-D-erythritol 2,4-cyclodiphosphate synthase [Gammaproteobacteria bacterium]
MRIGHGFDVHRFQEGRPLVLGGVHVPHPFGLAAHSDGDVVIHALCDALLGAAGEGDIGTHFPDSDPRYRGIDSRILLRQVVALLEGKGQALGNADITIVAQAPRLSPYLPEMRKRLAQDLKAPESCLNLKATTTERLGPIGRGEGIAAHAVVLIRGA